MKLDVLMIFPSAAIRVNGFEIVGAPLICVHVRETLDSIIKLSPLP